MWSEKRGIEGTIVFAIFPIVWCILGNISYYLSGIERFYNFTSVINIGQYPLGCQLFRSGNPTGSYISYKR